MMSSMGLVPESVIVIMNCVQLVSYRVKVNGSITDAFLLHRRLCQGDPLSLYLFILCAEAFSILLQQADLDQSIEGVQMCPAAPCINHLFFVDDSLIVMKANVASATKLQPNAIRTENKYSQVLYFLQQRD